jgi:hypothetical protein
MIDKAKMIDQIWWQTKLALAFALAMGVVVATINIATYSWASAEGRQSLLFLIPFAALGGVIFVFGRWVYRTVRRGR